MAKREDILQAAIQVFGQKGYDRATLDDVARLVGIKKASLYHHIESKEQLLWELHCSLYAEVEAALSSAVEGLETSTKQLSALIEALLSMMMRRQLPTRVMLRAHRSLSGEKLAEVLANRENLIATFATTIQRGVESGEFAPTDPRIVAHALIGMCYWVQEWYDPDGPVTEAKIFSVFERLAIDGLSRRQSTT